MKRNNMTCTKVIHETKHEDHQIHQTHETLRVEWELRDKTDITHTIAHPWSLWNGLKWQLQVGFAQGRLCGLQLMHFVVQLMN